MSDTAEVKRAQGSADVLTVEEREICGRVAIGDAPHSQRALALMALDQGVTQAEAAQLSGLTKGQVRYWRDRFREKRLGIFPESAMTESGGTAKSKASRKASRQPEPAVSADAGPASTAKKKPKKKKPKKSADKKKKAKDGKGKTVKAEKKSKKKKKKKAKAKGKKTKGRKARSASKGDKKKKKKTKGKKDK